MCISCYQAGSLYAKNNVSNLHKSLAALKPQLYVPSHSADCRVCDVED